MVFQSNGTFFELLGCWNNGSSEQWHGTYEAAGYYKTNVSWDKLSHDNHNQLTMPEWNRHSISYAGIHLVHFVFNNRTGQSEGGSHNVLI